MLPCEPVVELLKYEPVALADSSWSLRPVEVLSLRGSWSPMWLALRWPGQAPGWSLSPFNFSTCTPFSPMTTFFMCLGQGLSPEEAEFSRWGNLKNHTVSPSSGHCPQSLGLWTSLEATNDHWEMPTLGLITATRGPNRLALGFQVWAGSPPSSLFSKPEKEPRFPVRVGWNQDNDS